VPCRLSRMCFRSQDGQETDCLAVPLCCRCPWFSSWQRPPASLLSPSLVPRNASSQASHSEAQGTSRHDCRQLGRLVVAAMQGVGGLKTVCALASPTQRHRTARARQPRAPGASWLSPACVACVACRTAERNQGPKLLEQHATSAIPSSLGIRFLFPRAASNKQGQWTPQKGCGPGHLSPCPSPPVPSPFLRFPASHRNQNETFLAKPKPLPPKNKRSCVLSSPDQRRH